MGANKPNPKRELKTFYFRQKYISGGPDNGSNPLNTPFPWKIAIAEKYELTRKLEKRLKKEEFLDPEGDVIKHAKNAKKFEELLLPFLKSKEELLDVLGGNSSGYPQCSSKCRGGVICSNPKYHFVD